MAELDPKIKIKTDRSTIKALKIFREGNHTWPAQWGDRYEISKPWTERNNMVMDVIAHLATEHFKKKGQSERVFSYPDIETVKADEKIIHEQGPHPDGNTLIEVDSLTFRNITGKHYMTSKEILALFIDTANTSFIVSQPVLMRRQIKVKSKSTKSVTRTKKGLNPKETLFLKDVSKEEWVEYNWLTMPFELGWDKNDPNPSKFSVKLNTIFARVFVHNIRAKGYNLFDRRVYDLTGNAQNLYRYFILINQGFIKKTYIDVYEEDIVDTLDLHTPTVRSTIEGYLEELKGLKIVYSYIRYKDIYGKFFYRIHLAPLELKNEQSTNIRKDPTETRKLSTENREQSD